MADCLPRDPESAVALACPRCRARPCGGCASPRAERPLAARAAHVFGRQGGQVCWPYGLRPPAPPRARTEEALGRHEAAVADRDAAQEQITSWAESLGLKQSRSGCCPRWLQRGRSGRCTPWACTQYGSNGLDHDWLDHLIAWTRAGKPAAITAAPYEVGAKDEERLSWWTAADPRLSVARGTGWHGLGTTQIVMWRADLVNATASNPPA
ncbi:hypothetical protein AB0O18_32645 [Streptomyces sp. NPDC093224]|uniref:hypothetical protein n=1 Tax=Streptomyces sp. NPDC093224 TaxID=3155198 RepID=UPI00341A9E03